MIIGNVNQFIGTVNDILFVVYTERIQTEKDGFKGDVTRLISARFATNFERELPVAGPVGNISIYFADKYLCRMAVNVCILMVIVVEILNILSKKVKFSNSFL